VFDRFLTKPGSNEGGDDERGAVPGLSVPAQGMNAEFKADTDQHAQDHE
jgi:hypothetical protein